MGTHYQGTPDEIRALNAYIKLSRAADSVTSRTSRHLSEAGLTTSQFGVIEMLYHLGPLCQSDIAEKHLKSRGNITTVVDNLEKQGRVRRARDARDRRIVTIYLTEDGRSLVEEILPRHIRYIVEEMSILTAEEQEILDRLCRRLGKKEGLHHGP